MDQDVTTKEPKRVRRDITAAWLVAAIIVGAMLLPLADGLFLQSPTSSPAEVTKPAPATD